jgi:hypothetical protein
MEDSGHLQVFWGWHRREPVDANRVATVQRTLKRAKPYCASTGFTEAKIWHLLGSAARQRLLAIASAFDLSGAQSGNWPASISLVRKRSMRSNHFRRPSNVNCGVVGRQKVWRTSTHPVRRRTQSRGVVRCRSVFRRGRVELPDTEPGLWPLSAYLLYPKSRESRVARCGRSFRSSYGRGLAGLETTVPPQQ